MRGSPTYRAFRAYARGRLVFARLRRPFRWTGVRILGYHRIADDDHVLSVRPAEFAEQMERIRDAGLIPIRLDEAFDGPLQRADGRRHVSVTFDDAYRDNGEYAVPVLDSLGLTGTIYTPTAIIDGDADYTWFDRSPPALTWPEIRALAATGVVDFQAHTRTHPRLPHVDDDSARAEIVGSKHDLEEQLGRTVTSFAYPAGLYGARDVDYVAQAGYRAAVTTEPGVNTPEVSRFELRRTMVYGTDGIDEFGAKLAGHFDRAPKLRPLLYRYLKRS